MSQTFYKKGFLALAVAAALGVSAFAQADVKIGVAGPMTGANAAFGEQYMKGAQAAADAVNAAGGVNGEKIVLVEDTIELIAPRAQAKSLEIASY